MPRARLQDYAGASLSWCGIPADPSSQRRAIALWRAVAGDGAVHMPFGLVCDLGAIVEAGLGVRFASDNPEVWAATAPAQRPLRLRYENEVLGRLLALPAMLDALELLDTARAREGPARWLTCRLLLRLAPFVPPIAVVNPAHLRGLVPPGEDTQALSAHATRWEEHAGVERTPRAQISGMLERLSDGLRWSELLTPEDLFELTHWEVLDTPELRIGCQQVLRVARELGEVDLRTVRVAPEAADIETSLVDESHYPIGGIAELTRRGSIESLVPSELITMEPGPEVDLFDLRWVEGELLFYLRDGGELQRKRRTVHLICDLEDQLWFKPRGYPVQLGVLVGGLFIRLIEDLRGAFANDSVRFTVSLIPPAGSQERATAEAQVLALILADDVAHGRVTVGVWEPTAMIAPEEGEPGRKTYRVVVTTRAADWSHEPKRSGPVVVGITVPVLAEPGDGPAIPLYGAVTSELKALKNSLVRRVCGLTSRSG